MRRLLLISAGSIVGTVFFKILFTFTEKEFLITGMSIIVAYAISFIFVKNKPK